MPNEVQIGIWGGPLSGKTTFLGALPTAALLNDDGDWLVNARNDFAPGSTKFLVDNTNLLKRNKRFPPATTTPNDIACRVTGHLTPRVLNYLKGIVSMPEMISGFMHHVMAPPVEFTVRFRDLPGDAFVTSDPDDEIWEYLANCHGIVLLFDPVRELGIDSDFRGKDQNFYFLQQAIDLLIGKMRSLDKLHGQDLPQRLAVCTTKFDEPSIFSTLLDNKMIKMMPDGIPYVSDAQKAFRLLAEEETVRILERSFDPNRIEYFLTSSVGFMTNQSGQVDIGNYVNVQQTPQGKNILGKIRPINVLEPLIWLYTQAIKP